MEDSREPKKKQVDLKGYLTSRSFIKPALFAILGGLGGYLFYYFIGCSTGSCAITSNPYLSIIFGAFFGFYLFSSPCSRNKC